MNSTFELTQEDYLDTEEEIKFNKLVASTEHITRKNSKNTDKFNKQQFLNKVKKANRYGN